MLNNTCDVVYPYLVNDVAAVIGNIKIENKVCNL